MIPSFRNKVTTKGAKNAKGGKDSPQQIFAPFAPFVVTSYCQINCERCYEADSMSSTAAAFKSVPGFALIPFGKISLCISDLRPKLPEHRSSHTVSEWHLK